MTIEHKFIDVLTAHFSKSRKNSQFYNSMIEKYKFVRVHPVILHSTTDVMVSFSHDTNIVYPIGKELQEEVFNLVQHAGWFTFFSTGFSEDEIIEFCSETRYIETTKFTKIKLIDPTWDDLIKSPKIRNAEFSIMNETFDEFHNMDSDYEISQLTCDFFNNNKNKPDELELRVVFDDVQDDRKYGKSTILVFWKGEFLAVCNEYIERWHEDHSFYATDADKWREMMNVLLESSNIKPASPLRGVEIIDMKYNVEQLAAVPGFTDLIYGGE